jgi:protein phosphatase
MPAEEPRCKLDSTDDILSNGDEPHPRRVAVQFTAFTDTGKLRENNEDHFLVARLSKSMEVCKTSLPGTGSTLSPEEDGYLFIVADGMGGEAAGERASALAVESIEEFALNTLKWFLHQTGGAEEKELVDELRQSLERADRTVVERAHANAALHRMGTTVTMAYSIATDLFVVHAGDSRAYLFRDGELRQLTSDHTLVQALVDTGTISPEQAKRDRRRKVVTNAVGGSGEGVYVEIHKVSTRDGDTLLLCTDGLTEPVSDDTITEVLRHYPDPEDACNRLMNLALDAGGPDNVTAIVVRYRVDENS